MNFLRRSVLPATLIVLAGCGGGSDSFDDESVSSTNQPKTEAQIERTETIDEVVSTDLETAETRSKEAQQAAQPSQASFDRTINTDEYLIYDRWNRKEVERLIVKNYLKRKPEKLDDDRFLTFWIQQYEPKEVGNAYRRASSFEKEDMRAAIIAKLKDELVDYKAGPIKIAEIDHEKYSIQSWSSESGFPIDVNYRPVSLKIDRHRVRYEVEDEVAITHLPITTKDQARKFSMLTRPKHGNQIGIRIVKYYTLNEVANEDSVDLTAELDGVSVHAVTKYAESSGSVEDLEQQVDLIYSYNTRQVTLPVSTDDLADFDATRALTQTMMDEIFSASPKPDPDVQRSYAVSDMIGGFTEQAVKTYPEILDNNGAVTLLLSDYVKKLGRKSEAGRQLHKLIYDARKQRYFDRVETWDIAREALKTKGSDEAFSYYRTVSRDVYLDQWEEGVGFRIQPVDILTHEVRMIGPEGESELHLIFENPAFIRTLPIKDETSARAFAEKFSGKSKISAKLRQSISFSGEGLKQIGSGVRPLFIASANLDEVALLAGPSQAKEVVHEFDLNDTYGVFEKTDTSGSPEQYLARRFGLGLNGKRLAIYDFGSTDDWFDDTKALESRDAWDRFQNYHQILFSTEDRSASSSAISKYIKQTEDTFAVGMKTRQVRAYLDEEYRKSFSDDFVRSMRQWKPYRADIEAVKVVYIMPLIVGPYDADEGALPIHNRNPKSGYPKIADFKWKDLRYREKLPMKASTAKRIRSGLIGNDAKVLILALKGELDLESGIMEIESVEPYQDLALTKKVKSLKGRDFWIRPSEE